MAGINIQNLCIYGESPDYRFYGSFQNASQGMDKVKEFYYSLWNSSSRLVELAIDRRLPGDLGGCLRWEMVSTGTEHRYDR